MKKIISMLLLLVMVLSLCACGSGDSEDASGAQTGSQEKTFRVGYARYDITPTESVPLGGFGNTSERMSTNILRRVYVSCIAITDEQDNTILLIAADLQQPNDKIMACRPVISQATGVPEAQIMINGSHTHAGCDVSSNMEAAMRWIALVNEQAVNAAVDAMADRKPATMSYGSVETEGLNFIKHYKYIDENGETQYFGDNFGTAVYNETTQHTTQIDQTMFLMKFEREGDKDVVFASWRAHPLLDGAKSKTDLSSDYIGAFREAIELKLDCEFAFYQGAAGNNNSTTRLTAEQRTRDTAEFGALLADYAIDGLTNNMTKVDNPGLIQTRQTNLDAEINHDTDSLYYSAKSVQVVWTTTNDYSQAAAAGEPYGIRSPYMANAIVNRYNKDDTCISELDAFAIGDHVAIVSAPNELFDQLGEQTEAGSSYPMTVTLGYTNGYTGYIPTMYGFEHTSYETDVCWYKPGIGETMVDTFLSMLDEMDG